MRCREPHLSPVGLPTGPGPLPSISLEDGADECTAGAGLALSERGMSFQSRWQFSIGTELSIACEWPGPGQRPGRIALQGVVVLSEPHPAGGYDTTLLFLELPDELKAPLRELSHRLVG